MLALVTDEPPWKQAGLPCCHVTPVQPVSGYPMPCSGSARPNHQHLMRQEGWLQAEDSCLWDTWRHRTRGSAAAPTGARGGSGPLPKRGAEVRKSALWDTWRRRTLGSAAAPTGACEGSGLLPK